MRARFGRPEISVYADLFAVPAATPGSALTITWAGVSTLLISDGTSAVLTDGFFTRPSLPRVGLGRISPSMPRIDGCLARLGVQRLDAVLPVHTHYDHALDSAVVAQRTGAALAGGTSAANIGRGQGLPESRIIIAGSKEPMRFGTFDISLIESHHCPPDRFPGTIIRVPTTAVIGTDVFDAFFDQGGLRDDVARITQNLAYELEFLIRRAPEQWHLFQPNWPWDPGY